MGTHFGFKNSSMASFERDKIESNANPRNMNSSDNGTESTHTFISSLVINLSLSLLMITLFSILRPRLKRIYAPRQILLEMIFPLGKLPHSFFAWVIPAFVANDDDVFYYAGIDALVYMRFLKLCIKISFLIFPYGIAVLLPLNCYGTADLSGLDKLSMSNLGQRSERLWAHLVAAWVYTLIICYLLYLEWKIYIMYRQEYLSNGKSHQYAVLVRDVPRKVSKPDLILSSPVLEYSTFVKGIIEGFLSSVTLWVFFAILPWILRKLTQQEGITSRSEVDISVLGKLFIFMIINKFLFLTAGSAALTVLKEIINHPREIPRYLAQSLPGQSTFFICYIMLRSFVGFSMELLRIVDLIVIPIRRKWFSHTPREDEAAWRPPPVAYDSVFTD
ncbi:PREDICTED: CSC1-like protein ERD4, partial [Acropora digitifera]|uniref:CSC1-like protein ERD4 n=1 Tax=Acropora digitifera TaxID=70779 RepID=UPI00077A9257